MRHLWILIAPVALYLAGANVFLRSALFDRVINGNPQETWVKTQAAYSLFPGWVRAGKIEVRGQDSNVQWLITVENARLWVSLRDLLFRRSFHVTQLRAESGAFQLRLRRLTPKSRPEQLQELPPIPGFGPETLLEARAAAEKKASDLKDRLEPDRDTGLKQVRIEDIEIPAFKQIWVGPYRFDGKIDVSGTFTLYLGRQLVIPEGRLGISTGKLTRLDRGVLQDVHGVIDANIGDFEAKTDRGLDFFRTVSAKIALSGGLDSIDPFSILVKKQDWFALERIHGTFAVDASVRDGRIAEVPLATVEADPFVAGFSRFGILGRALVHFDIAKLGVGRLEFELPRFRISGRDRARSFVEGKSLKIALTSPDLQLAHLYELVLTRVRLQDARIVSFDFLKDLIPPSSGFVVAEGDGTVSADISVSNDPQSKSSSGWAALDARRLRIKKDRHDLVGQIRARARVRQTFPVSGSTRVKELDLSGSEVEVAGSLVDGSKSWRANLQVRQGRVRPDEKPSVRAQVTLQMPDVSPFLSEFGIQSGLGKVAQNLLESGRFEGSTDMTLGSHWTDFDHIRLTSQRSRILGFFHFKDETKEAAALIHYGAFSLGVGLDNSGTHLHLLGAEHWYETASRAEAPALSGEGPLSMR